LRNHVSPDVLSRFFQGEAAPEEARAVVAHLLTGCPLCMTQASTLPIMAPGLQPEAQSEGEFPDAYDLAIDRAIAAVGLAVPDEASALHNRLLSLVGSGRLMEAFCCFTQNRDWLWEAGGALERIRLLAIEGRIHAGLGHLKVAESAFRETKWRFAAAGIAGQEALATLNLASVLKQQGRSDEAAELAEEALQAGSQLRSRGVRSHRH